MKTLTALSTVVGFALTVLGARCLIAPADLDKDFVQIFGTIFGVFGLALLVVALRWTNRSQSSS